MTEIVAKLQSHFARWREWEMNPIVIKELRQGVRSWTVTGMLLLFLVVLFIASLGFLITQSFNVSPNMGLGASMFSTFVIILAGASVLFIPLYVGVRVAAERQENNHDLLYVTTLSPTRIILGKFLCSAYIALAVFQRVHAVHGVHQFAARRGFADGVFHPRLLVSRRVHCQHGRHFSGVPADEPAVQISVRPRRFDRVVFHHRIAHRLLILVHAVGCRRDDDGTQFLDWRGHRSRSGFVGHRPVFRFVGRAHFAAVGQSRIAGACLLTALWLLGGLLCSGWIWRSGRAEPIDLWLFLTFAMSILALLVVISNGDQLSMRVQRTIPRPRSKRIAAFLFFNGAAGGLLWIGGILTLTFLITRTVLGYLSGATSFDDDHITILTTAVYAFAYALTALFMHRKFLAKRPPKIAGLLALLLAGAWALMPSIALFFLNKLSWKSVEGLQLGNVFNVFFTRDSQQLLYHELFAYGWLLVAVLLNAKWFLQQVKNFRPPEKVEPPAIAK